MSDITAEVTQALAQQRLMARITYDAPGAHVHVESALMAPGVDRSLRLPDWSRSQDERVVTERVFAPGTVQRVFGQIQRLFDVAWMIDQSQSPGTGAVVIEGTVLPPEGGQRRRYPGYMGRVEMGRV